MKQELPFKIIQFEPLKAIIERYVSDHHIELKVLNETQMVEAMIEANMPIRS